MGSYSKSIVQDLRTVVEGAEVVSAPESQLTQPLSIGLKADEWMQGVSISQVMPGGIQAGGNVTVEEVSSEIINRVLQSSDESLSKILQTTDEQLARADLFTEELVNTVLETADKNTEAAIDQANQAIQELGDVTMKIAEQQKLETEAGQAFLGQVPGFVNKFSGLVLIGLAVWYIVKKKG